MGTYTNAQRTHTKQHTHMHTRTRTRAHTHTHTHTHTQHCLGTLGAIDSGHGMQERQIDSRGITA